MNNDNVGPVAGWLPPHSVAMLLLATARAGTRPAPPGLMRQLIAAHIQIPGLRADPVMRAALEELETHWQRGGLRAVFDGLQVHCRRLSDSLDEAEQRQVIASMLQVAAAVTDDGAAAQRVRAFPYAAARVWKLEDAAASILSA